MTQSLLPPNSTPLERVLEGTIRIEDLPVPIDIIRDPWACPVNFLPLSAWENSVDFWNDNWSEQTKRKVIAAAWEVHQYKGTTYGLEVALGALDFGVTVSEWFKYGGNPGYFNLDVDLFDRGITNEDQVDILAITELSKRESQHLDTLKIHIATKGNAPSISCAICIGHDISVYPLFIPDVEHHQTAPIYTLGTQMVQDVEIYPKDVL